VQHDDDYFHQGGRGKKSKLGTFSPKKKYSGGESGHGLRRGAREPTKRGRKPWTGIYITADEPKRRPRLGNWEGRAGESSKAFLRGLVPGPAWVQKYQERWDNPRD